MLIRRPWRCLLEWKEHQFLDTPCTSAEMHELLSALHGGTCDASQSNDSDEKLKHLRYVKYHEQGEGAFGLRVGVRHRKPLCG